MKRILIGLSLMAAACSGSLPTSPSGSSTVQSLPNASAPTAADAVVVNPVDPTPPAPGANAPTPQYTLTGPRDPQNCFTAGTNPMQWVLNVTDAGPRTLRLVAVAHHDDQPGCDATVKNPRSRLEISGVTAYTPHSSGQTTLTFNPLMYSCGRVQVDVSIFDAAGNEILVIGIVINYGTVCAPTTPPALACVPGAPSAPPGTPVTFSATGGTGGYTWSTPGGSPATGAGASMSTTYSTVGSYVATVSSGGATATCSINIISSVVTKTLVCVPPVQTVGIGATATLVASGGTGSYTWSAPGGSTASGSGTTFSTSYPAAGANTVTVTSGAETATCQVTVVTEPPPTPVLICAPPTQAVAVGVLATMTATGGTAGAYTWSAPGGSPAAGSGATFSTSYPTAGVNTVTVTSGGQTASCAVTVTPPVTVVPAPICAPASTNPAPAGGVPLTFNITNPVAGVLYTWATAPPGGTPPGGAGTTFTASFTAPPFGGLPITYTVTPSAPGLPGTPCVIAIPPPLTPPVAAPLCFPDAGNPPPTAGVPLGFSVFNPVAGVTYSWAVTPPAGATPAAATGNNFSTSLAGPPAGSPPITYTITPSAPGSPGVPCTVVLASSSTLCPPAAPSFNVAFPLAGVLGRATVNGPGVWEARLLAATTFEKYLADTPDVVKDDETVPLVCLSPTTPVGALIEVTYPWGGHPDRYWWMVLYLNGVRVYKSPVAINPTSP